MLRHWRVTRSLVSYDSCGCIVLGSHDNWRVTRSLVSYDCLGCSCGCSSGHWRVTRSLVSYDSSSSLSTRPKGLKGHQIIGELRHLCLVEPPLVHTLKGHQIIGELRRLREAALQKPANWRVTRSLVSYDLFIVVNVILIPYWRVTRSLVSYDESMKRYEEALDWRVTRSLVSYDDGNTLEVRLLRLKGHQIIGELRQISIPIYIFIFIEGSPDHWWVTTSWRKPCNAGIPLKGHQIIGELRRTHSHL